MTLEIVFGLGMACGALVALFAVWFANITEDAKKSEKESEDR